MGVELKNPQAIKMLEKYAEAAGCTIEEALEFKLTKGFAVDSAWGDCLGRPSPGIEFVKHQADGTWLTGDELYQDIYQQTRAWLNSLLLGEKLLMTLVDICQKADLLKSVESNPLKGALARYTEKIEKEGMFN